MSSPQDDAHLHCLHCHSFVLCSARDVDEDACPFLRCALGCGAVFHCCKETEHMLLCPRQVVECLNAQHGCPARMPRSKLGFHLSHCPASVVVCMAEWNRWPMHSSDRQSASAKGAHRTRNPYASEGQLGKDTL